MIKQACQSMNAHALCVYRASFIETMHSCKRLHYKSHLTISSHNQTKPSIKHRQYKTILKHTGLKSSNQTRIQESEIVEDDLQLQNPVVQTAVTSMFLKSWKGLSLLSKDELTKLTGLLPIKSTKELVQSLKKHIMSNPSFTNSDGTINLKAPGLVVNQLSTAWPEDYPKFIIYALCSVFEISISNSKEEFMESVMVFILKSKFNPTIMNDIFKKLGLPSKDITKSRLTNSDMQLLESKLKQCSHQQVQKIFIEHDIRVAKTTSELSNYINAHLWFNPHLLGLDGSLDLQQVFGKGDNGCNILDLSSHPYIERYWLESLCYLFGIAVVRSKRDYLEYIYDYILQKNIRLPKNGGIFSLPVPPSTPYGKPIASEKPIHIKCLSSLSFPRLITIFTHLGEIYHKNRIQHIQDIEQLLKDNPYLVSKEGAIDFQKSDFYDHTSNNPLLQTTIMVKDLNNLLYNDLSCISTHLGLSAYLDKDHLIDWLRNYLKSNPNMVKSNGQVDVKSLKDVRTSQKTLSFILKDIRKTVQTPHLKKENLA
ncbi:hypothetical protein QVD99_008683 [Batrachochytrium dendrobatidis]|nr:hypothetical protein QVD99_008683 [Batrachochytrium dendrobatidis]